VRSLLKPLLKPPVAAAAHQTLQREAAEAGGGGAATDTTDTTPLCAALREYRAVVAYTAAHSGAMQHFRQESALCEQLLELLPTQIEALRLGRSRPTEGV
jgi:hypothetical protein